MPHDAELLPSTGAPSTARSLDDWLTPEAVEADYPFLTADKLTKFRMGPDGPAFTKVGRTAVYRRGDLLDWLRANSREK
jgi:hypothetical protein